MDGGIKLQRAGENRLSEGSREGRSEAKASRLFWVYAVHHPKAYPFPGNAKA